MSKKTFLKLGLICAVVFILWRLWEDDAAVNAFILFCTAGIVPGTSIELTPEQVYIVLGTILFIAIIVIFAKELLRDMRAIRTAWQRRRAHVGAALEVSEPTPEPVVIITLPRTPGRFTKLWYRVRPKLIIAVGAVLETTIKGAGRMAVLGSRASLRIYRYCMQAWLFTEPYLRRFDKWLERTLKSNKDVTALLHLWAEFLKNATARLAELRLRLARAPRTPED